jgi:hypothetical protein
MKMRNKAKRRAASTGHKTLKLPARDWSPCAGEKLWLTEAPFSFSHPRVNPITDFAATIMTYLERFGL